MHHPTHRITHTTSFITPVVDHWLEREVAQWVHYEGSNQRWANALTTELHLAPNAERCQLGLPWVYMSHQWHNLPLSSSASFILNHFWLQLRYILTDFTQPGQQDNGCVHKGRGNRVEIKSSQVNAMWLRVIGWVIGQNGVVMVTAVGSHKNTVCGCSRFC